MDSILGRFMNRDPHPTPYVDGMNLYQYVRGMALVAVDPMGLACATCLSSVPLSRSHLIDPIRRKPLFPLVPPQDPVVQPPPPPTPYQRCTAGCDKETPENSVDRAWCYHDCRREHDSENCGGMFFDHDLIPRPAPCVESSDCAACCLDNAWGAALGCWIDVRAAQCACRQRGEPNCDQVGTERFLQCQFGVLDEYLACLRACPKLVASR
jgi:hypothetical protein